MSFSDGYMDITYAFIVTDYRRNEFVYFEDVKAMDELKIGVLDDSDDRYFVSKVEKELPQAKVIWLKSFREFFENESDGIDALLSSAEGGSAWTLLYPDYQVVVPIPKVTMHPLAYAVPMGDHEMVHFINSWIDLKKKDGTIEKIYNY